MTQLQALLREATQTRFWGQFEISFQDGEIVMIKKSQTIKPHREHPDVRSSSSSTR